MKKNILLINILLLCSGAFFWQSCQYNACKARDVQCENEGVCDQGECVCVLGYEGEFCEIPVNSRYASHYAMVRSELINSTPPTVDDDDTLYMYANQIKRNIVYFYSIRDSLTELEGNVRENALTIPEQTVIINNISTTYFGEGSLNGDKLTITLTKKNNMTATSSQITYVGRQYETF